MQSDTPTPPVSVNDVGTPLHRFGCIIDEIVRRGIATGLEAAPPELLLWRHVDRLTTDLAAVEERLRRAEEQLEDAEQKRADAMGYARDFDRLSELYGLAEEECEAGRKFRDKLAEVENSPQYMGVWTLHHVHGGRYNGPTWISEIAAYDAARAARDAANRPASPDSSIGDADAH